jgi:carbon-monoxide dehydrogenase medium subunit
MPLPPFTYLAPRTLQEACALLAEHGERARLMAGGTDLIIRLRHRAVAPAFVIGLRNVPGLDHVRFDARGGLVIGAAATLAQVAEHPEVRHHYPALATSAGRTATVLIRNMGTVAGNLCNAAPSADNAPPLLVYGARLTLAHPGGERILAVEEFFRGPGLTALETGEILKEIHLPPPSAQAGSHYEKISARGKVDIAAVGVAALVERDDSGACRRVRMALGAVAPVPMRARGAERVLEGKAPSPELLEEAAETAAGECSPISDVRASASYRRLMVRVLAGRALRASLEVRPPRCA